MISHENIDFANSIGEHAVGRIPAEGLDGMSVNDYIASLTNVAAASEALGLGRENLDRSVGMYSYIRDTHGAQSLKDVTVVLCSGKVDPKVVDLWVEEGFAVNPREYDAIAAGYPDKVEELKTVRDKVIDRILGKED